MRRAVFNICVMILAFVLQTSAFMLFPYTDTLPNLMLVVVTTIAFAYGDREGMLYGLLAGFLADLFYSDMTGMYMLLYLAVGFGAGQFFRYYEEDYIILPLGICAAAETFYNIFIYVVSFLIRQRTDILFYLMRIIIPELILTLFACLLVYRPLQIVNQRLYRLDTKRG